MSELGHNVLSELSALDNTHGLIEMAEMAEVAEAVEWSADGMPDGGDLEVGADADHGDAPKVVERPVDGEDDEGVDDDDVDDEIVDIFVEEAQEILQSLTETYPRWLANQQDGGLR